MLSSGSLVVCIETTHNIVTSLIKLFLRLINVIHAGLWLGVFGGDGPFGLVLVLGCTVCIINRGSIRTLPMEWGELCQQKLLDDVIFRLTKLQRTFFGPFLDSGAASSLGI
jgi:hypothetical protein